MAAHSARCPRPRRAGIKRGGTVERIAMFVSLDSVYFFAAKLGICGE